MDAERANVATPRWLPWLAGAVAAIALFRHVDLGAWPEVTRLRDDAFYGFVWARSLAAGDGPCVTPGAPTSGVHLAWVSWLALLVKVVGAAALPIAAQCVGLAMHVATAFVVGRIVGGHAGVFAALLYVGAAEAIVEAHNGQETAFACLALAVVWRAAQLRSAWFVPAALLLVFVRSDLLPVVAAVAFVAHGAVAAGVLAGLAFVALGITHTIVAGAWWQDSTWPIPWLFAQHFERGAPDLGERVARAWWLLRPCLLGGPFATVAPVGVAVVAWWAMRPFVAPAWRFAPLALVGIGVVVGASDVLVAALAAALVGLAPRDGSRWTSTQRIALAVFVGLAATVALHHVWRGYPRGYYFVPFGVLGAVAIGEVLRTRRDLGVAVAAAALVVAAIAAFTPSRREPWQIEMALAGAHLHRFVPSGEAVGCFNSGIVAWRHGGPVVNLDGVVHRAAFDALRAGALDAFLDDRGVRFVVDTPVQFRRDDPWPHASGVHFGAAFDPARDLVPIARFDAAGVDGGRDGTEAFVLHWRRGRGERPPPPPLDVRAALTAAGASMMPAP